MARASATVGDSKPSPRRGVLLLPGLGNNAADYGPLAAKLEARGMAVEVAQVTRPDWGRNAAALTDVNWWKGTLKPRPAVDWYLAYVDASMQRLKRRLDQEAGGAPITMLTHSAGGWLGRVYLLDWGTAGVDRFVSLGSPHRAPPAGAAGVVDQTRGILNFVSDACPGAHHSELAYVTICGKFVRGVPLSGPGSEAGGLLAKFAGAGYQQVCGSAQVWGDFIVPQPAAHLEGALQVDLEGVFHSPLGEKLPFFGPWYGSDEVLERWVHHLTGDPAPAEAAAVEAVAAAAAAASGSQ
ncbi:hypothetical protein CHLRE_07g313550v5 [Chlamydomonas reinhardtii]|uniref:GPI inositol-deacylase n=1 Tax=Chlamydomonas reinhardtii TaxID=3055 RepID=A0A2K3DIJ4_CHLRE|nr:uncharacterized protein CHLRE_07g313550v5 [Chlamydomonas reinhardtii]PNW80345.1 hypothetical protein CHLRE_07g313550v5 [Chlamydomonas reinhardtii]